MNDMDKKKLLKELDLLGYSDRVKRIAILGRDNKEQKNYSKLLSLLLEDGVYEGNLALVGAGVTKDINIIRLGLKHPMASIRKKAVGLLAKFGSNSDVKCEILSLSSECRLKLFRNISYLNRQELAEEIIEFVYKKYGAKEALLLLPVCSKETVSKCLVDIGYAVVNWRRLANLHTDIVAEYFKATLGNTPLRQRRYIWNKFSSALEFLCKVKADFILDCARDLGPSDIIYTTLKGHIGTLTELNADKVYVLLVGDECRGSLLSYGIPSGVLKRIGYLSKEQCIGLAKLLVDKPLHIAKLLHYIKPSKREDIFEAVYEEDKRKEHVFPKELLYELPHKLRDKEARRMIGLREIYEDEKEVIKITACTLIDNSRELLEKATEASEATERSEALVQLIRCTGLSRDGVYQTLAFLGRIKNDQDPVRCAVILELCRWPVSIFKDENIKDLNVIVDSAIEARDTSYSTQAAIQKLAFKIMRYSAVNYQSELFKFSLNTLIKLIEKPGYLRLPSLEQNLPKGIENKIFDGFYPLLVQANKIENYNFVIDFADSLGKRGFCIAKLQDLLKEAIKSKSTNVSARAVSRWLAPRETRDARVKELLNLDRSFITIKDVFLHLHTRRQEWLDSFISGSAISGKFLTGNTIYLIPATDGFNKWLPRQQEALSLLLERIIVDPKRSVSERSNAIRIIGGMPDISLEKIIRLLSSNEVSIVEATLHALSVTENPEKAISILLENLGGGRARVAMYSIPRCIRRVNPSLLTQMLKELLNKDNLKITVRKEAIRILGDYRDNESISILMNEFEKTNIHKDVIIAIGHAARKFLDDENGWNILSAIASSPERDVAKSLLYQNANELPKSYRDRYLELIIKISNHKEADVGREAFNRMIGWENGNEELVANIIAKAICDLEDTTRWKAAMNTLVEIGVDGKVDDIIIGIFKDLASVKISDKWNSNNQRDLPHRQRLFALANKLISFPYLTALRLRPLYRGIIDSIASDETLKYIMTKFYIVSIDWNEVEEVVDCIKSISNTIKNHPHLLNKIYCDIVRVLRGNKGYWKAETILEIIDIIWIKGNYEEQFIGLSLLEVVGSNQLWTLECVERLRLYRNHENIELSSLALDIWVAID